VKEEDEVNFSSVSAKNFFCPFPEGRGDRERWSPFKVKGDGGFSKKKIKIYGVWGYAPLYRRKGQKGDVSLSKMTYINESDVSLTKVKNTAVCGHNFLKMFGG
jgi:hypothetical protein